MESRNKVILVTGGCGFIGSNFINFLYNHRKDVKIINLDAMHYCASHENIKENIRNDKERYHFARGNINSEDLVTYLLNEHSVDTIVHFAAQSHVQNSFDDSIQFTIDNVLGTHHLLEAARKYGGFSGHTEGNGKLKLFIHVSTDEVYGSSLLDSKEQKKTEQSVLCPTNPYAATKAGAELIAGSYYKSYHIPIIVTRSNNVYGPNQYPEKLIPKFIKLLKEGQKVTIQGDGSCVRAFVHVDDIVKGFAKIMENGTIGEIYNIGGRPSDEFSVMDISKKLILLVTGDTDYNKYITYVTDRPYNDTRYFICDEKIRALGWDTEIDIDTGLKDLV